ncbi:MAG: hypothetical protein JWP74_2030 [Marmoricola sp.]|nr:hypothetical protein [Marmoricola sp.]
MSDDTTPPPPSQGAVPPPAPPAPPAYGSAPPPPPYGSAPPPPPPAYNAPPATGGYDPAEAIKYGWAKFKSSPTTLLVPVLVTGVALIAVYVVMFFVVLHPAFSTSVTVNNDGTIHYDNGPGFFLKLVLIGILVVVISVVAQIIFAALIKGGLDVADGKTPAIGELFEGWDKGQVLVAAVIVGAGTGIGSIFCYVPGIVFAYLAQYTQYYVVDKHMSPIDALKASFSLTTSHFGSTFVFYLLAGVVIFVGAIPCGVGLLAAVPVVLIGQAYTFRMLHNEPVSPAV